VTGGAPLKEVGFYRSAEEVRAAARPVENPWERMAVRYLEQGRVVLASPGWADDLLDEQVTMICRYSTLTDGTWIWPSDLAYYVRTYHVVLPEDFLRHMASRDWVVPGIDDAELETIGERLERQFDA
jgi:hypothetical protein